MAELAQAAGYRHIAHWGHSLGSVKTSYSLVIDQNSRVQCAICSSPPRFCYERLLTSERGGRYTMDGATFAADIERARRLVDAGQGDQLMPPAGPLDGYSTAEAFLDRYGPDDRYDYFRHLPNVRVPLLLTVGGLENAVQFRDLAARGPALRQEFANVSFALIGGADHSYSTRIAELWAAARSWLETALAGATTG